MPDIENNLDILDTFTVLCLEQGRLFTTIKLLLPQFSKQLFEFTLTPYNTYLSMQLIIQNRQ